MPNQLNYGDTLVSPFLDTRPSRLTPADKTLVEGSNTQILIGTSPKDYVEFWVYDTNGQIIGHTNVNVKSPILQLYKIVDNSGAYETLNIDMGQAINATNIEPGRYVVTLNFFRDEVGAENDYKLFISDISTDRTELQLKLSVVTDTTTRDLYEWVVPSVPQAFAQGLLDETFGLLAGTPASDKITPISLLQYMSIIFNTISNRLSQSGTINKYNELVYGILSDVHDATIVNMANDINNTNVQIDDVIRYVTSALSDVLAEYVSSGKVDPHFEIL
jgi:hypothetical protein